MKKIYQILEKAKGVNWQSLIIIFFVFLFILRGFFKDPFAYSDFVPFSYDFRATLSNYLFLWSPDFLGIHDPKGISYIFRAFFEAISFNDPGISQGLFIMFFLLLGYTGILVFLKRFNLSKLVRHFAAAVFVFNPVIIAEISNGAIGILITYSLIPYLVILCQDLLVRYSFLKGFLFSLIIGTYLFNPQSAFWILIWLVPFAIFYFAIYRQDSKPLNFIKITKTVFAFSAHTVLGALLNITFLSNYLAISSGFKNLSYLADFQHNYLEAKNINLIRLIGNWGSPQATLGYFDINFFSIAAFVFPLLIIACFAFTNKKFLKKTWAHFFAVTVVMSIIFMVSIRIGLFEDLILSQNSILVSARNPQKLFYFFAFAYTVLLAISIESFLKSFKKSAKWLILIFFGFLFALYAGWNKPIFSGDFLLSKTRNDAHVVTEKYQRIYRITKDLKNGPILFLPFDYSLQLKTYWINNIVKLKMGGTKTDANTSDSAVRTVYEKICKGESDLAIGGIIPVSYVVLDKNPISYEKHAASNCQVTSMYGTPYIWGDYNYFNNLLRNHNTAYEDKDFKIYELNTKTASQIFPITSLIYGVQPLVSLDPNKNKRMGTEYYVVKKPNIELNSIGSIEPVFSGDEALFRLAKSHFLEKNIQPGGQSAIFHAFNLSGISINGQSLVQTLDGYNASHLESSNNHSILLQDENYTYENTIPNGSFENGLWHEKVADCYNYDDRPVVAMRIQRETFSSGQQSLELEAGRHIACSHIKIPVSSGKTYVFKFDYQSPNSQYASYHIGFNDEKKSTTSSKLPIKDKKWQTFSTVLRVPDGADSLTLHVYSSPHVEGSKVTNRYDNFELIEVPDIRNQYFLVKEPENKLIAPKSISYEILNPTKKLIHIRGASTSFFLGVTESFNEGWKLYFANQKTNGISGMWWPFTKPDKIQDDYHFKLNGFLNTWYIDINEFCSQKLLCTQNSDGTYDLEMVMEFWPQRWFYLGAFISSIALTICLIFIVLKKSK